MDTILIAGDHFYRRLEHQVREYLNTDQVSGPFEYDGQIFTLASSYENGDSAKDSTGFRHMDYDYSVPNEYQGDMSLEKLQKGLENFYTNCIFDYGILTTNVYTYGLIRKRNEQEARIHFFDSHANNNQASCRDANNGALFAAGMLNVDNFTSCLPGKISNLAAHIKRLHSTRPLPAASMTETDKTQWQRDFVIRGVNVVSKPKETDQVPMESISAVSDEHKQRKRSHDHVQVKSGPTRVFFEQALSTLNASPPNILKASPSSLVACTTSGVSTRPINASKATHSKELDRFNRGLVTGNSRKKLFISNHHTMQNASSSSRHNRTMQSLQ